MIYPLKKNGRNCAHFPKTGGNAVMQQ